MGQTIIIKGVTYEDCEMTHSPLANGQGDAYFYDVSGSTLSSGSQMLDGIIALNSEGTPVTGSIPSRSQSDLTVSGATVTVPAGNYSSQATKSVASGSVTAPSTISGTSASVSTGTNTLTLTKSVSVTPNVTTAGYVSNGTAGNSTVSLTASVTTKAAATITPGTTDQTISSGTYLTGTQTIKGDSNLVASNIVAGHSIFNVQGSAQVPTISYDSTLHSLSIS